MKGVKEKKKVDDGVKREKEEKKKTEKEKKMLGKDSLISFFFSRKFGLKKGKEVKEI